jgi:hypothetical protein
MILPDLNLLLYAYNPHMPQHGAARHWWEKAMNGDELIGLPSEVVFGSRIEVGEPIARVSSRGCVHGIGSVIGRFLFTRRKDGGLP